MQTTTNYGFKKPESTDPYNINDFNETFEVIDRELKEISDRTTNSNTHPLDLNNPHQTTAEQVGLGNVPNVATNDQTPTYTIATTNTVLSSGEKLSVAFGKIAKAITSLISHLADSVCHVTSAERTTWNAKQNALGYTPVQQGGGIGQLSNTVKVGWSGSRVKVTIDATDMGNVVFDGQLSSASVNYATSAGTATNATNASNADKLDGLHASSFIQTSQSAKVIVSTTAPSDTTAVWIVP